jgi:ParB family chromosome partitioning protein
MLALIRAGYEKTIQKDSSRSGPGPQCLLTQLVAWGYKASEVEQIVLSVKGSPLEHQPGREPAGITYLFAAKHWPFESPS